jgi:VanZ like family
VSVSLVLAITLVPGMWFQAPVGEPPPLLSLDFFLADFLANCLLFLPFGASVALASGRARNALICSFLLSASVETAQVFMLYRYANPFDVLANALGGLAGALLWNRSLRSRKLSDANATRACVLLTMFLASMLIVSSVLLLPAPPAGRYYLHAPPQILGFEPLPGDIRDVSLDGVQLERSGALDSDWMRQAFDGDFELRFRVRLYERPTRPSLLLMISAEPGERTVLALRLEGDDLVFRYRAASNRIRLDAVEFRADKLLQAAAHGQTFEVVVSRRGYQTCLGVESKTYCEGDLDVGQTWALYLPQLERLLGRSVLMTVAWVGGWSLVVGGLVRFHWASGAGVGALVVIVWAAGQFGTLQPLPYWGWLVSLGGLAIGATARLMKSKRACQL